MQWGSARLCSNSPLPLSQLFLHINSVLRPGADGGEAAAGACGESGVGTEGGETAVGAEGGEIGVDAEGGENAADLVLLSEFQLKYYCNLVSGLRRLMT